MRDLRPVVLLSFVTLCCVVLGMKSSDPAGAQLQTFANAFLDTLTDEQKSVAVMPYDSPQRVDWHFIPKKTRKGLVLREMNESQKTAAMRLIKAALSEVGYVKATDIILLEGVLNQLEGPNMRFERDPGKYFVTIFGTPSDKDPWGLSFEGHHLSLNFVCRDGRIVDSTPQLLGSNPATIMSDVKGPLKKGTRVLRLEEELGFALVDTLDEDQQTKAIIADKAPRDIRFAGEAQISVGEPEGIAYSDLSSLQQKILRQLVDVYADTVADEVAQSRRDQIDADGWDNVYFAWAGATTPGIGHYYRIRGKDFLIELCNVQPDAEGNLANHIHAMWRDVNGDFDLPSK